MPSPSVANDILAFCSSCKMDLQHVVVAMKGDKAQKVKCKTCEKTHGFKAPKGITEAPVKKAKTKRAPKAATVTVEAEWTKLMATKRDLAARGYNTKQSFVLGEKIAHPSFGEGLVNRLVFPNKIEVIFQQEIKLLIHAGAAPIQR